MKRSRNYTFFFVILTSFLMVGILPIYADKTMQSTGHNQVMSVKEAQAISEQTLVSLIQKELNDYKSKIETNQQASRLNQIESGSLDVIPIAYTRNGVQESMDFRVFDGVDYEKSLAMNASDFNTSLDTFSNPSHVIALGKAKVYETNGFTDVSAHYPIHLKRDTYRVGSEQRVIFLVSDTQLQVGVNVNIYDTVVSGYGIMRRRFQGVLEDFQTPEDIINASSLKVYDENTLVSLDNATMNQSLKVGLNQEVTLMIPEINLEVSVYGDVYDVKSDKQGMVGHDFIAIYDEQLSDRDLIALAGVESHDIQKNRSSCAISVEDNTLVKGKNVLTFKACDATLQINAYLYDVIDNENNLGVTYDVGYLEKDQTNYQDVFNTKAYVLNTGEIQTGNLSYEVSETLGLNQWTPLKLNNQKTNVTLLTHRYRVIEDHVGILGEDVITTKDLLDDMSQFESQFNLEAYQLPENTPIAKRNISIQNHQDLGVGLNQTVNLKVKGIEALIPFKVDVYQTIEGYQGLIAHDIIGTMEDVQTPQAILEASKASVWNVYTQIPLETSITVMNTLERKRGQVVALQTENLSASINADIFDVYDPVRHEGISADNFKIVYSDLAQGSLKANQIKTESAVEAWDTRANKKIKDNQINADTTTITKPGTHAIEMRTAQGTSITIQVEALANRIEIEANPVVLEEEKAYQTGERNLLEKGHVVAENKLTDKPVENLALPNWDTVLSHKLPTGKPITLEVKATDGRYEEVSSMDVYVLKSIDPTERYGLDAKNASSTTNPETLSDAALLELIEATPYKIENGRPEKTKDPVTLNRSYLGQGIVIVGYKDLSVRVHIRYQAKDESELRPIVPLPDIPEDPEVPETIIPDPKAPSQLIADDVRFDLKELQELVRTGRFEETLIQRANVRIYGQDMNYPIQVSKDIFGVVEIKDR